MWDRLVVDRHLLWVPCGYSEVEFLPGGPKEWRTLRPDLPTDIETP